MSVSKGEKNHTISKEITLLDTMDGDKRFFLTTGILFSPDRCLLMGDPVLVSFCD